MVGRWVDWLIDSGQDSRDVDWRCWSCDRVCVRKEVWTGEEEVDGVVTKVNSGREVRKVKKTRWTVSSVPIEDHGHLWDQFMTYFSTLSHRNWFFFKLLLNFARSITPFDSHPQLSSFWFIRHFPTQTLTFFTTTSLSNLRYPHSYQQACLCQLKT